MRLPRVLRPFSRLISALQGVRNAMRDISVQLGVLCKAQAEMGPAAERLDMLDRQRHQFEAQCEGLLLRAEGKFKAANNAEARERALKKSYERIDPFPEDGVEPETPAGHAVPGNDAPPSEENRLRAMRLDVAPTNNKALAQRAKFGVR